MPASPATDTVHDREVSHETPPATAIPASASEPVPAELEVKPEDTNDKVVHIATTTEEQMKEVDALPDYALQYAPIVYLDEGEQYFPSTPTTHCSYMRPLKFTGDELIVPEEYKGKISMLKVDDVNQPDVFLTMDNVRQPNSRALDQLKSISGKPNTDGRSEAPVWIVVRDKTGLVGGEGTVEDVFYFFFYSYNLGNTVLLKHFGNHVGDWEHAMIRFRNGKPEAMHLSAHSDGNAWYWNAFAKKGDRPIIYSAAGSHANYPKIGVHDYSGVLLVGPSDHTSNGFLWDPALNFVVGRSFDTSGDASAGGPSSKFAYMISSAPGFNKSFSPDDVVNVLTFQGRWGNSFSDLRRPSVLTEHVLTTLSDLDTKANSTISSLLRKFRIKKAAKQDGTTLRAAEEAIVKGEGPAAAEILRQESKEGGNIMMISPYKRLLVLVWAEGPTGPRDKSLERRGMNRWKDGILTEF